MSIVANLPGSKSLTNRALLVAAATDGVSVLRRPLVSADTVAFVDCLRAMGYGIDTVDAAAWRVHGSAHGPDLDGATLNCVDAGTAARFLPVLAASGHGRVRFDGSDQLRRRPLRPLFDALTALGADVVAASDVHDMPFDLVARGLPGGEVRVDGSRSSQFLTGLLLSAPLMKSPPRVHVDSLVSGPYVTMTIDLMRRCGVEVLVGPEGVLEVQPDRYRPTDLLVEPDASTASYFFAAAALTGATLTVPGLGAESLQGDMRFVEILARMGVVVETSAEATTVTGPDRLRGGFTVDMGDISDTFMTMACLAPYADAPIEVTGIAHARLKESDRIEATAQNLR
ncbi:MAG: 3-phosphoshikimate 1-carboxyvinyltransferase, partial [Actinomycetia bacterium]|nr:3-phosphoshikimate 1-carboxyvinyltransferase [Actinomycetes bacterium]